MATKDARALPIMTDRERELEEQLHAARKVAQENLTRAERAEARVLALELGRDSLISFSRTCYQTLRAVLEGAPAVDPFATTEPAPADYSCFGGE